MLVDPNELLGDEFVTFQVVFVGADGILIGSDMKMVARAPGAVVPGGPFPQFGRQSKFVSSEDVLCACSGSQEGQRIAREIVGTIDPEMNDNEWESALDRVSRIQMIGYAQLVVVRKKRLDHAVWVVAGPDGHTSRIETRRCVGAHSSACFLTQNFWPGKQPLERLIPFALVVLDYGRTEYPCTVGEGFELRRVTENGIGRPEIYNDGDERVAAFRGDFERKVCEALRLA